MGNASGTGFWADIIPKVTPERCRRCPDCPPLQACLAGALCRDGKDGLPHVAQGLCFGCYSCATACPYEAIVLPGRIQAARRP